MEGVLVAIMDSDASGRHALEALSALKPAFLRYLLTSGSQPGESHAVCYLDPDVEVYHPFSYVADIADEAGIVLTPHVLHPLPRDGRMPDERALGLLNLIHDQVALQDIKMEVIVAQKGCGDGCSCR